MFNQGPVLLLPPFEIDHGVEMKADDSPRITGTLGRVEPLLERRGEMLLLLYDGRSIERPGGDEVQRQLELQIVTAMTLGFQLDDE